MEKITKRAMFEALVAHANECEMDVVVGDITITAEDFVAFATKEIEALDKKAAKAKERAATKRSEGDALTEAVLAVLTDEFQSAADVMTALGEMEDVTAAKVSYRLNALAKDGKAVKEDIKVDRDGKKAVLKGYKLA